MEAVKLEDHATAIKWSPNDPKVNSWASILFEFESKELVSKQCLLLSFLSTSIQFHVIFGEFDKCPIYSY